MCWVYSKTELDYGNSFEETESGDETHLQNELKNWRGKKTP